MVETPHTSRRMFLNKCRILKEASHTRGARLRLEVLEYRIVPTYFPPTTVGIHAFEDQLPSGLSSAMVQFLATHTDGTQKQLLSDINQYRAINPNYTLLHYQLGTGNSPFQYIINNQWSSDWSTVNSNESYFAHQSYSGEPQTPSDLSSGRVGTDVTNSSPTWEQADIANPAWQQYTIAQVLQNMAATGANGWFADSYTYGLGGVGYNGTIPTRYQGANAANPADWPGGVDWTPQLGNWAQAIENAFSQSNTANGTDYKFIPNLDARITGWEPRWYDNANGVPIVDGAFLEGFGQSTDTADWTFSMNQGLNFTGNGKIVIMQPYLQDTPDSTTGQQERDFYLGTYLLLKGDETYLNISQGGVEPYYFPEYQLNLGAATTALPTDVSGYLWNGVYRRDFQNGFVLVNPGSTTNTLNLGGNYEEVQGHGGGALTASQIDANGNYIGGTLTSQIVSSVTLTGGTAAIFLNPPKINTANLPTATAGRPYTETMSVSGGTLPFTFALTTGSLPPGLSINTSTGAITGTPTSASGSPFSFTVTATDAAGATASRTFSLTVIQSVPTTTLSLSASAVSLGQPVTLTATVAGVPSIGTPTGTVSFEDNNVILPGGTVSLSGNTATLTISTLAVGTHPLTALYNGDAYYLASSSAISNLTVVSTIPWDGYAKNPQHTALSPVASQPLDAIRWETPVDLDPQYSGDELLIHYGSPSITAANTVIVPVKTGASGGFEVNAYNGRTGATLWMHTTDYQLPPSPGWTQSYAPALTPSNRYYFAGNGGTVYYINDPDGTGAISGQFAFFGMSNYNANPSAYNSTVFISTPITSDDAGNIYFGFQVTGTNPLNLISGIARIAPDGTATWTSAQTMLGDTVAADRVVENCAPALSNDGHTVYVAVDNGSGGTFATGDLVALNSATLAVQNRVALKDPSSGNAAYLPDNGTASPTVGPDGKVYFGVLENPFPSNNDRGWLLQFSADLSVEGTPGSFGWDDTASIVPASMVPSYHGTSTYLLMTKYNNYASIGTGNGLNEIAILDPNASENNPVNSGSSLQVMKEVLTILGQTPDSEYVAKYPGAVHEWCINNAVVDPATDSILANSEDGKLYRWDLSTNTFTQVITLTAGLGEAYTPTLIGPDGTVYAINNAILFAVGNFQTSATSLTASPNPSGSGTSVTFAATVTGPAFTPSGTVTFLDGTTTLGTGTLNASGVATFSSSGLSIGSHSITASYGGDQHFAGSTSSAVTQIVNAATTTTLTDNGISQATAGGSIEVGYPISFTVTVTGTGTPTGTVQLEDADNGNASVGAAQTLTNGTVTFMVAATAPNNLAAGIHQLVAVYQPTGMFGPSQSTTVGQVIDPTFNVQTIGTSTTSKLSQTATGFVVTFNAPVNTSALNLYGTGPASLTFLTGTTSVPGSLVFDPAGTQATFVATGSFPASGTPLAGILTAGANYALDLSGTNASAFQDSNGHVLGSSSGTGGGDFTSTFTSTNSATAATISVPYFARGYSQTVNVLANTTNGLPISIDVPAGGTPVTSASFDVFYDPTLLTVSGGQIVDGNFTGSIDTATAGEVQITLSGGPLAAGTLTNVVSLTASVPSTAPYRDKEILDIRNISINGGTNNGQDGSAVHAATFLDATQGPSIPSTYSAQDAFNILKASAGLPGALYNKLLDPTIVADDSGAGRSSAQDAFDVIKKAVGLSVPLIPDLPSGGTPPPVGGPDPYLYLDPFTKAAVGSTVTVHVNLKSLQSGGFIFDSSDLAISFDPTKVQISNVRAGSYSAVAGFGSSLVVVANPNNATGTLLISEFTTRSNGVVIPDGISGDLVEFDVTLLKGFTNGSTVVKLNANIGDHFTDVNGGAATLNPAPNNQRYNPATDDRLQIDGKTGSANASSAVTPSSASGHRGTADTKIGNRVLTALIEGQSNGVYRPGFSTNKFPANNENSVGANGNSLASWILVFLKGSTDASGAAIHSLEHGQSKHNGNLLDSVFADYVFSLPGA